MFVWRAEACSFVLTHTQGEWHSSLHLFRFHVSSQYFTQTIAPYLTVRIPTVPGTYLIYVSCCFGRQDFCSSKTTNFSLFFIFFFGAPTSLGHHFPHALQNLYSCWSYWQFRMEQEQYSEILEPGSPWRRRSWIQPVLYYPPAYKDMFDVEKIQKANVHQSSGLDSFLRFLYDLGVAFRPLDNAATAVRPRLFSNHTPDGFALQSSRHAAQLREAALDLLQLQSARQDCSNSNKINNLPHITILDRKSTRRLLHVDAIRSALEHALFSNHSRTNRTAIPIVYFEDASFATQIAIMSRTDILISPHGAQLSTVPFLRDCATVLEIFPFRYCLPYFYGSLAASSDLTYAYMYMGDDCLWDRANGGQRRAANLCLQVDVAVKSVLKLVEEWKAHRSCHKTCKK